MIRKIGTPAARTLRATLVAVVAVVAVVALARGVSAEPRWLITGAEQSADLEAFLRREVVGLHAEEAAWFGRTLPGEVTIDWVVDGPEFQRRTGRNPGAVGGVARADRGEIVLNASSFASNPQRIRSVLHHELVHLFFYEATRRAEIEPPLWLNEGIAMWRSGEWDLGFSPRQQHGDVLRDALAAGSLFSLAQLDHRFPDGRFFTVAYAQSRSFVEWLLARSGEDGLRNFLAELNRDRELEEAFLAVYGQSLEAAEASWRRSLGGGIASRIPSGGALFGAFTALFSVLMMVRFVALRLRSKRRREEEEARQEALRAAGAGPPGEAVDLDQDSPNSPNFTKS